MSASRDPDRIVRAWLDLMPDEAPERTVAAVLEAVETLPQVRRRARPAAWRLPPMNRFAIAFTIVSTALILAAGAILLAGSRVPDLGVTPAPSIRVIPSQTAGTSAPQALLRIWVGEPRDVPGLGTSPLTELDINAHQVALAGSTYGTSRVASVIMNASGGVLRLLSSETADGCRAGDSGSYGWTLSSGGTVLTIQPGSDTCATRASMMPGQWYRVACDGGDNCLGNLEAGTYPTHNLDPRLDVDQLDAWHPAFGALRYTVPDGWTNPADNPSRFWLMPTEDYRKLATDTSPLTKDFSIYVFPRPAAVTLDPSCWALQPGVERTPSALVDWIAAHPGIKPGDRGRITVDGHDGAWIDVGLVRQWNRWCPNWTERPVPDVQLLMDASGDGSVWGAVGPFGDQSMRLIVLDLGQGDSVLIVVVADDPTRFTELVDGALPIIQSFTFR